MQITPLNTIFLMFSLFDQLYNCTSKQSQISEDLLDFVVFFFVWRCKCKEITIWREMISLFIESRKSDVPQQRPPTRAAWRSTQDRLKHTWVSDDGSSLTGKQLKRNFKTSTIIPKLWRATAWSQAEERHRFQNDCQAIDAEKHSLLMRKFVNFTKVCW